MVDLAATIFRDFEIDGIPASGSHKPRKAKIREWGAYVESGILGGTAGSAIFASKATMTLTYAANTMAWVIGDPAVADNGIYRKIGASGAGSWSRVGDLPHGFIKASNAGTGTANAIVATTSLPLPSAPYGALILMNVFEANTGAVTIAINGAAAKPLVANSGGALAAGYLAAGMLAVFVDAGMNYRLVSDVASAAIQAAAEAAAQEAADHAAGVNLPPIQAGDAGKHLVVKATEDGYQLDASSGGAAGNTGSFYDYTYIPANQIVHIRNQDTASQDASVVTAGLQAMHQAMMDFLDAGGSLDRQSVGVYRGRYAVNGELFSEAFAQKLWDMTTPVNARFIFDMLGAEFYAKGWPSHKAVRTSGWYAARGVTAPVPMVMFRWEQKTKRGLGPHIIGGGLKGEKALTDPIGMKLRNVNKGFQENFEIRDFRNVGRWIDDINNSDFVSPVISSCGLQPTQAGGTGFLSSTVRFSTVAGSGTSTITATEAVFNADHVGKWIMIEGAGASGSTFCAKITSRTTTTAVVDKQCTTNVSDMHGSFVMIAGTIAANSATLVLSTAVTIDLVGRYVMVYDAGSKVQPDNDILVTRVIAQAGDNKTLTLASQARVAASNTPVALAPSTFTGKCDDQVDSAGVAELGHNNDCQFFGERNEFSFDQTWGGAVSAVEQYVLQISHTGRKMHGTNYQYNNFGGNGMVRWLDACKTVEEFGSQHEWGHWHPEYAMICVSGARNCILLPQMGLGAINTSDHVGVFYMSAQSAGDANCRVGYSGFFNQAIWGLPNQAFVRAHPTKGTFAQEQLVAIGPFITRAQSGYPDMRNAPVSALEIFHASPRIIFRDTNDNTGYRIVNNGGGLTFARDLDGDGTFEEITLDMTTSHASFTPPIRSVPAKIIMGTVGNVHWSVGTGSPEGVVPGSVGSLYTRTDGGAGTTLYVKQAGAGASTGWAAK